MGRHVSLSSHPSPCLADATSSTSIPHTDSELLIPEKGRWGNRVYPALLSKVWKNLTVTGWRNSKSGGGESKQDLQPSLVLNILQTDFLNCVQLWDDFVRRYDEHDLFGPIRQLLVESVSHSVMSDSTTSWTVAHQVPLSLEFSRQEY